MEKDARMYAQLRNVQDSLVPKFYARLCGASRWDLSKTFEDDPEHSPDDVSESEIQRARNVGETRVPLTHTLF